MKKTINVNIGRSAFVLDEDAYQQLQGYLRAIEGCFSDSEGKKEIMEDIELRIAELLTEKLKSANMVIATTDIDYIIEVMGPPEDYVEEASESKYKEQANEGSGSNFNSDTNSGSETKRFYRDPDDRVLSGVCAGLGHYIGLSPMWVRLVLL